MAEQGADMQGSTREVIDYVQFQRMMKDHRGTFFARNDYQIVTLALIAVNVVVFAVEMWRSGIGFDISTCVLIDMGAMLPAAITSPADFYRFVTPMFLHLDVMHLLMNMMALYSVCVFAPAGSRPRELRCCRTSLRALPETWSLYAADLVFGTGMTVSAGASTSVFGLFVAVALLGVLCRGDRHFIREYSRGMIAVILVNIAYTLLVPGNLGERAFRRSGGRSGCHAHGAGRLLCALPSRCALLLLSPGPPPSPSSSWLVGGLAFLQGLWAWRSCPYWRNAFSSEECVDPGLQKQEGKAGS